MSIVLNVLNVLSVFYIVFIDVCAFDTYNLD